MENPRELAYILIRHFKAQTERYEAVKALSEAQLEPIRERNTALLMELLARKQEIIRDIDAADADTNDIIATWESIRETVPMNIRQPVIDAFEALRTMLKAVIDLEEDSRSVFSHGQPDKQAELQRLQKSQQLHRAYGSTPARRRLPDSDT